MRHWTQEERQRQAELIRTWQPWKHSTGAKTIEGKAISARNAFTGGFMQDIRTLTRELNQLLKKQREDISEL